MPIPFLTNTPPPPAWHAVDQLTKFNQRLADLCPDPSQRHLIDGIVLTKFDTIDDKVGSVMLSRALKDNRFAMLVMLRIAV